MAESRRAPLKAVGGAPARVKRTGPRRKTVAQAAADGDIRGMLIGSRLQVAAAIDHPDTPKRDLAALTRRLIELNKDIEAMDARDEDQAEVGAGSVDESFDASSL